MQTIGNRIATARADRGWSQKQLAERLGCKPEQVSMWESGRRNPRPKAVAHLAQTLNASYTWLLTGQGPMHLEGVAEQGTPYRADALDAELLAEIIAAIQEEFAAKGKKLLPKALGVFCVEAYQEAQRNPGLRGDALLERLKPFIRLALAGAS